MLKLKTGFRSRYLFVLLLILVLLPVLIWMLISPKGYLAACLTPQNFTRKNISDTNSGFAPAIGLVLPINGATNVFVPMEYGSVGARAIKLRRSTDGGTNFVAGFQTISQNGTDTQTPQIAVVDNYVYIAWVDIGNSANTDIYFAYSQDYGVTFSAPLNISNTPTPSDFDTGQANVRVTLVASDKYVYVTWLEQTATNTQIYFKYSANNGGTFSCPAAPGCSVSSITTADARVPQLAAIANNVQLVWTDIRLGHWQIYYSSSTDNGQHFTTPANISQTTGRAQAPQLASVGQCSPAGQCCTFNVYAVWMDDSTGRFQIYFAFSTNGGTSFTVTPNISNSTGTATNPHLAAVDTRIYMAWEDSAVSPVQIYYARSPDSGTTIVGPTNVSQAPGSCHRAMVAVASSNVFVTWDTSITLYDVYFNCSSDKGATFGSSINLSNNTTGGSTQPRVAATATDSVHIVDTSFVSTYQVFYNVGSFP